MCLALNRLGAAVAFDSLKCVTSCPFRGLGARADWLPLVASALRGAAASSPALRMGSGLGGRVGAVPRGAKTCVASLADDRAREPCKTRVTFVDRKIVEPRQVRPYYKLLSS